MKLVLALILFSFSQNVWAGSLAAQIFEKGTSTVLFTFARQEKTENGVLIFDNAYKATDGTDAVLEHLEFKDQKLTSYQIQQKQLGDEGLLTIQNGKAHVKFTRKDAKPKSIEHPWKDNSVVTASLVAYVMSHWEQAKKGPLEVDLFVMDRMDSYTFTLSKDREETMDGQKQIVLVMKPAKWFLRQLVDPLYFHFLADGSSVLRIEGRTAPKRFVGGKYKDLDANMIFKY